MKRRLCVAALLAAMAPGPAAANPNAPASNRAEAPILREYNVRIPMRDGVELSANIYRPRASDRVPVILIRTPYGRNSESYERRGSWWASRGYALVVQDVRGRGDSDGRFRPFLDEAADGYDTQSWAGTRSWSNGRVGTTGGSYLGWTQLYPAGLNNPHLAAMVPTTSGPDPHRNFPLQFGVPMVSAANWAALVDGRQRQSFETVDLAAAYQALPLIDFDRVIGRNLPFWREWLDHPSLDGFWRQRGYQASLLNTNAPAMHVSGWYDDVLIGTLENFSALSRRTPSRGYQKLVIGPWGHRTNAGRRLGDVDFGPQAVIDFDGLQQRWFDRWLRGIDNGVDREPPVRLFVMGLNQWRDEQEWPLARTHYTRLYLHSGGRANGLAGDGLLGPAPPGNEPPDRYDYDPANPVPFLTAPDSAQVGGPDDYRQVEARSDVLVYTTPPYREAVEVCGPIRVRLHAATSARDTDWTAKLLVVHADGFARRLNDGIVRARYRAGLERPVFPIPNQAHAYDIDLWATCIRLAPGERLRLEIASSAYPKFDRNMNTGGPIGREGSGLVARQSVFHDRQRPSYVLIPFVPLESQ